MIVKYKITKMQIRKSFESWTAVSDLPHCVAWTVYEPNFKELRSSGDVVSETNNAWRIPWTARLPHNNCLEEAN